MLLSESNLLENVSMYRFKISRLHYKTCKYYSRINALYESTEYTYTCLNKNIVTRDVYS